MRNLIFRHPQRGVDDMEMASICQLNSSDLLHIDEKQTNYLVAVFRVAEK